MTISTQSLGILGEQLIATQLKNQGFIILAQNYRKLGGEIDIIAKRNDVIVFVEVKTRRDPLFDMSEVITLSKQRKIISVAKLYIAENKIYDYVCQFDVALIAWHDTSPEINYIENAFNEGQ